MALNSVVVRKYFPITPTRIEGIGLMEIEKEIALRHDKAFTAAETPADLDLEVGGEYRWRRNGEQHAFDPISVATYKRRFDSTNQKPIKNMPSELMSSRNDYLLFVAY